MDWLKHSGLWINLVFNPYHWVFDIDFGGESFGELIAGEEPQKWFWFIMLLGPINVQLFIDNGEHEDDDAYSED